jgi:hypothetical protein
LNQFLKGTFKAQKSKLVEDGYNVTVFKDKTYYFDLKEKVYKELTVDIYQQITKGQIQF